MRLHRAMIYVSDFPRMKDFYTQVLGAGPADSEWPDSWAEFDAGGAQFALHAIPAEHRRNTPAGSPPKPREASPVKLFFEVDDVEAERVRLERLGATIVQRPWGAWEAIDPEGNIFALSAAAGE